MHFSLRSFRTHAAVYLLYLALAILITWPLVTVFSTHFPGFSDGDAHEMTRHIWWFKYALQHGQPLIFQPLLAYPDGLQGVILWSDPLQFFPGWLFAFFMPLPAAYNLQMLLTLALNGWAGYWLVGKLTRTEYAGARHDLPLRGQSGFMEGVETGAEGRTQGWQAHLPALLAGVIFMAAPTIQGHLSGGHGGLLVQWPLALLAYSLLWVVSHKSQAGSGQPSAVRQLPLAAIVMSAVLVVLTAAGHTLQLIYAVMPLAGVLAATLVWRRDWRGLLWLALAVGLGCALMLVFLLPVFSATFGTAAYTDEGGAVRYSADLLAIGTPSFFHVLFGQWEYTHRVLGLNMVEGSSYVGLVATLLAVVAVWKVRAARWWLLLAVVAWVLSLGPLLKVFDQPVKLTAGGYESYITLPWAFLYDLPGFNLARTPGRFNFVLALAVAVLAGYGSCQLLVARRKSKASDGRHSILSTAFFILLAVLVLFEYQAFWPMPTYSAEIPQPVYDLAQRTDVRAVFDMPWDDPRAEKDAIWLQTAHEKPMIAGQVTRRTPVNPDKLAMLQDTLNPDYLKAAGADVIILHKLYIADPNWSRAVALYFGSPFYEDDQLALFNVPETALQEVATMTMESDSAHIKRIYYSAEPGWIRFDNLGFGITSDGREVTLTVDGEPFYHWKPSTSYNFGLWLPLPEAGYHDVQIRFQQECPLVYNPILRCPVLQYAGSEQGYIPYTEPIPGNLDSFKSVAFERGVTLEGSYFSWTDHFSLGLWWDFDQPVTGDDVRFVKLLDEQGNQASGADMTLNPHAAGEQWADSIDFPLSGDLAPGVYKVCVGWYNFVDQVRFPVLSQVEGAQDGMACIGTFTVPKAAE